MCSSAASSDDPRTTRNIIQILRRHLATAVRRKYGTAALNTDLYGSRMVLSLWVGLLLLAAIGELLPCDSAPILAASHMNDKFMHLSAYAAIAFVPTFGLRLSTALSCLVTTEIVGIGLDVAQIFVRQRSFDPYDIAANTAGILIGIVVALAGRSRVVRAGQTLLDD
jgi:VanZ family protein